MKGRVRVIKALSEALAGAENANCCNGLYEDAKGETQSRKDKLQHQGYVKGV